MIVRAVPLTSRGRGSIMAIAVATVIAASVAVSAAPSSAACAAPEVSVEPEATAAGQHIRVDGVGFITRCDDTGPPSASAGPPARGIELFWEQGDEAALLASVDADADASFSVIVQLPESAANGTGTVRARVPSESGAEPPPAETTVMIGDARAGTRVAGADRIATSVAVSQRAFPDRAAVVYLARADVASDAVAGGVLRDGPILVVPQCGDLPEVVAEEIRRLRPGLVATLGGSGAVCDAVLAEAMAA